MFTGIIEETGTIRQTVCSGISGSLTVDAAIVLEQTKTGDSIAVNGVCLTVSSIHKNSFTADVMSETLRRTNLGTLHAGDSVNLERAIAAGGRFGGHILTGHIDGTGRIRTMRREGNAVWVTVDAPAEITALVVEKGSIAIDGISLTVTEAGSRSFSVSIIPHTGRETILRSKKPGELVNLENDILAKYIKRLMQPSAGGITLELLKQNGF